MCRISMNSERENMQKRIMDIDAYMPVLCELLKQGKEVSIVITGNSMSPFLVHGRDEILISPPDGNWKKGDMAFYRRDNGQYVMHRICKVRKDASYDLVGDAQRMIERPIFPEQMFGKITSVKRKGKWIGPGKFWWEFFEHFWVNVIPARHLLVRSYGLLTFWKHRNMER